MQDWIADYRVVRPLDDPARPGTRYVVEPPARLALRGVTVVAEIGDGDPADLLPDLSRWAGAAAAAASHHRDHIGLVVPLEVGGLDGDVSPGDPPGMWVSRLVDVDDRSSLDPVAVVAGAARGLAALHEAGGVHGAISAGRMLVTPTGGVLDLAPPAGPAIPGLVARVASPGLLDGVAPEVARGEPAGPAADIWALGACLHMAVTGQRVRPGLDGAVLLTAVQRAVLEPARIDAGGLSELLAACCRTDPAQRPSAAAVAEGLEVLR